MEYLGKKRENNNIKIKSFSKKVNKKQNKKNVDNYQNSKNFHDKNNDFHEENNNINKNHINKNNNCNGLSFYCSNNEKILYISKNINSPKVFNSSFDEYNFFCSYNSFINNRPYNEDRILINCQKINNKKIHLFAIFDGHGGDKCCNYLMNNFDKILFSQNNIINNTPKSLKETYFLLENKFKEINKPKNLLMPIEKSGSCALSILNIGKKIFCSNLGDSRALYSENGSDEVYQISYEHKPQNEIKRIKKAGGSVLCSFFGNIWRLFPGGIAVRTIYNSFFRFQDLLVIYGLNQKNMVLIIKL